MFQIEWLSWTAGAHKVYFLATQTMEKLYFGYSKRQILSSACSILIIAAIAFGVLMIIFPFFPQIDNLKINLSPDSTVKVSSGALGAILNNRPVSISVGFTATSTLTSRSLFDVYLESPLFDVLIKEVPEFKGSGQSDSIYLKSRDKMDISAPIALNYTIASALNITKDPGIVYLRSKCLASPPQPIEMQLIVTAKGFLGYPTSQTYDETLPCPNFGAILNPGGV